MVITTFKITINSKTTTLFTVPYFFVRSFRYTASYCHRYCTEGAGVGNYSSGGRGGGEMGGEKNIFLAPSQTAPAP